MDDLEGVYQSVGRGPAAVCQRAEWKRFHAFAWPQICAATGDRIRGLKRETFPLRKGDIVMFSPRVVHGTMPRLDPSRPRKYQISEWRAVVVFTKPPEPPPAGPYNNAGAPLRCSMRSASPFELEPTNAQTERFIKNL